MRQPRIIPQSEAIELLKQQTGVMLIQCKDTWYDLRGLTDEEINHFKVNCLGIDPSKKPDKEFELSYFPKIDHGKIN